MAAVSTSDPVLTEFNNLHVAVGEIESKITDADSIDIPDDVLPSAAQEMGAGETSASAVCFNRLHVSWVYFSDFFLLLLHKKCINGVC